MPRQVASFIIVSFIEFNLYHCKYIYIYTYTYIYLYMFVYMHIHIYVHTYIYIFTDIVIHSHREIHVHIHVVILLWLLICMLKACVCMQYHLYKVSLYFLPLIYTFSELAYLVICMWSSLDFLTVANLDVNCAGPTTY